MRALLTVVTLFVLAGSSCAGDSSSIMSVWNDGGLVNATGGQGGALGGQGGGVGGHGGGVGGQGGQIVPSFGGSGGGGGVTAGGSIDVQGGKRDLATAMCTVTTGNACPVPASYIACLQGNCSPNLSACHYSDGVSTTAGGVCQKYANCMLGCPCDSSRQKCEDGCTGSYATANPECSTCLFNLLVCSSRYGCTIPTTCTLPAAGGNHG